MSKKNITIGIDLGTTFSCVASIQNKMREVLEDEGRRITPSIVGYDVKKNQFIVGEAARRQMTLNPQNTVFIVKRFMGMENGQEKAVLAKHPLPYKIVPGKKGSVVVEMTNGEQFAPEVISAHILKKIREIAAKALNVDVSEITKAVITVPAYFSDAQRQATKDAGIIAGLEVLRIINEPTAAALAYGMNKNEKGTLLVFDLGGGTFDISILEIEDNFFTVKASVGDDHLGGSDFDNKIIQYIIEDFKNTNGIDLSKDPQAFARIKEEAEKTKIALSSSLSVDINIPFITTGANGPLHINLPLTRAKFESLCSDLLKKIEDIAIKSLKEANINVNNIDNVLFVGGMTRMPKITEIVEKCFNKSPLKTVNPDEAVAKGAAILANILGGNEDEQTGSDVLLLDVTPMSLGIETLGGIFTPLITKQTTIPVQKKQVFSTAYDNQTAVTIVVYQGERPMAKDNKMLGQFNLEGIAPAPKGMPQIEVCFDVDANGIVNVSATDVATKKSHKIRIESGKMSDEEIQRHMEEVKKHEEEDRKKVKLVETKNRVDGTIDGLEKTLKEYKDKIPQDLLTQLEEDKVNLLKAKETDDIEQMESLIESLNQKLQQIGQNIYQQPNENPNPETNNSEPETTVE
jgi:molecular chaperone DnaK